MNEIDYCNTINEAINEHFREQNDGFDSDVWCDERIEEGVIALTWHTFLDEYITEEYVTEVAEYIFNTFNEINQILTPFKDFERGKC